MFKNLTKGFWVKDKLDKEFVKLIYEEFKSVDILALEDDLVKKDCLLTLKNISW